MIYTDQLDRQLVLMNSPPRRIISLVPSQTELLADLGLNDSVVGITKFCVHPNDWRKRKTIIGGTKQLHLDRIRDLKPDLIIANQEENDQQQVEELAGQFPVWVSKVVDLESALDMILQIGTICDKLKEAEYLASTINSSFETLSDFSVLRVAYLIWRKPYMISGRGTFIDAMMKSIGFENVFGNLFRYPEVSISDLQQADPEVILLSSEPYPFKEKHLAELQEHCPRAVIMLVDGELFSWYGSRLLHSASYFRSIMQNLHQQK